MERRLAAIVLKGHARKLAHVEVEAPVIAVQPHEAVACERLAHAISESGSRAQAGGRQGSAPAVNAGAHGNAQAADRTHCSLDIHKAMAVLLPRADIIGRL